MELKKRTGVQWIADIPDPWTDIYYYKDMLHTRWAATKDAEMERRVLENADHVVVVSDAIKRMFAAKSERIKPQKIHVIPNGYDEADFSKIMNPENDEHFVIGYTGTLAGSYHVDAFIRACKRLYAIYPHVRIKIAGRVAEGVLDRFPEGMAHCIGYVDHEKSVALARSADALLLVIPNVQGNEGILTGKLFEYLATEKPIIGIGPAHGDAAAIIRNCKAGEMFQYEDEDGIFNLLESLIKHEVTFTTQHQVYSRKNLAGRFAEIVLQNES